MIKDFPTDVGLIYEGERIRKQNMFVELGGPKSTGAELLEVGPEDQVKDEKINIVGPDVLEMEEGTISPLGIYIQVAGPDLEEDLEGVFERRVHDFCNYVKGFMHLNSRDIIWCRIDKEAKKAGLSLTHLGQALAYLFKSEFDVIKNIEITFYTDQAEAEKFLEEAKNVYAKRDLRIRDLSEEDVDVFYGCVLCQGFAPEHVCTITPDRTSSCGSISWFEGRAAVKVDPNGPLVEVPKGELIDAERFEYTGVNEMSEKRSQGAVTKVLLHSIFDYPHTSCGCYEAIAFYIPEVDGIGVVHRDFKGTTPFGIPFSTMAGQTGGGQQLSGFSGVAKEYLRSPKFFIGDGGWNRTVWLPKELKETFYDDIPADVRDKIATEEDATDLDSLKSFLQEKDHPVVANWKKEEVAVAEGAPAMEASEIQMSATGMPVAGGGVTIVFKNAKIYAEKVIIKKEK